MSERASAATSSATDAGRSGCRRAGRLRRKLTRVLWIGLALAIAVRLALPFALQALVAHAAGRRGLEVGWEELDLSLLGGALELWHLDARWKSAEGEPVPHAPGSGAGARGGHAGSPLAHLEYVTIDADVSALLRGRLVVHRVEADGVDLHLRREADGSWDVERLLAGAPAGEPPAHAEPVATGPGSGPIDFSLPVEVAALRLQHARLSLWDAGRPEAPEVELDLQLRASDIGSARRPARLQVLAHSPQALDVLRIEGTAAGEGPQIEVELDVALKGLRPAALAGLLAERSLRPVGDSLDFSLQSRLSVEITDPEASSASARSRTTGIVWSVDGRESFALDELSVEVARLARDAIGGVEIALGGLRGSATRTPEGRLRLGGFEILPPAVRAPGARRVREPPSPAATEAGSSPEPTESATATAVAADAGARLVLDSARLVGARFSFHDAGVAPATDLELAVDELAAENLVLDRDRPGEVARLRARLRAPGVAESIRLDGRLTPCAPRRTLALDLAVEGLGLERLAPHLAAAGLASDLEQGRFEARLEAEVEQGDDDSTVARLALSGVRLEDESELVALDRLAVDGIQLSSAPASLRVGELDLSGTRLAARRDAQGRVHVAGLTLGASAALPDQAEPPPDRSEPAVGAVSPPSSAVPRIELGSLRWTDSSLRWSDESLDPRYDLILDDLGLELDGFAVGGAASDDREDEPEDEARLRGWFSAAGLAERLSLEGVIASRRGALDLGLDLALRGEGLALDAVAPYLEPLGIESRLQDARLGLDLDARLRQEPAGWSGALALTEVGLENAGETAIGLRSLSVTGRVVSGDDIRIGPVVCEEPVLRVARDADGGLHLAGLRLTPPARAAEPTPVPEGVPRSEEHPRAGQASAPRASPAPVHRVHMEGLNLSGATVHWRDDAVRPPVESVLTVDAELEPLTLGAGAAEAELSFELALDGMFDAARVDAALRLDPDDFSAGLVGSLAGLRAGPLASYLPPTARVDLRDGRLRARFDLASQVLPEGGRSASFALSELDFRDGEQGEPLLSLESLRLDVSRIDLAAGVVELAEISSNGFELDVARTGAGTFELLGLALETSPAAAPAERPAREDEARAAIEAASAEQPARGAPGGALEPAVRTQGGPGNLPTIRLEKLDLGLDALRFHDRTAPGAATLVAGARLRSKEPAVLLDATPEDLPPIGLVLEASAEPLMRTLELSVEIKPWASDPRLRLALDVAGLRGAGLTEVLPGLAEAIDGRALEDGSLRGTLEAVMRVRRRHPTDFGVDSGFGLELELADVELSDRPGGELLAGLESLRVEARSVRPVSGDVHLRTVEIAGARARATKEPDGVRALGLLLRTPAGVEVPATETTKVAEERRKGAPAEPADERGGGAAVPAEPALPGPELRVDQLLVSGIELDLTDASVDPPLRLPLRDLNLEVERFSTLALSEQRPIHFRASLTSAAVELPERDDSSLLGGVLGAAAGAITGATDEYETELRPAFEEIALDGRLALHPAPRGFARVDVRALELANFRGPAARAGVDLADGILDTRLDLRLLGSDGLSLGSRTIFGRLSVSEPADGPISTYLRLPAPLDTVLWVLRDENGEQVIPLNVSMDAEGLSASALAGTIVTTLGQLIGEALASSPMRIAGGVLDMTGLFVGEPLVLPEELPTLAFEPGATEIGEGAWAAIEPVLDLMRRDESLALVLEHELGSADLEHVARLANPTPEARLELAARLRGNKVDLLARRDAVAADIRARYAVGATQGVEPLLGELRSLDRELWRCEAALDGIYGTLRPGAEGRADARTREAALELARLRLDAARTALLDAGVRRMPARLDVRRPRFVAPSDERPGAVRLGLRRRR